LPTGAKRLFQVIVEPNLDEIGYTQLPSARDKSRRRGDIALLDEDTGIADVIDIRVVHPKFDDAFPSAASREVCATKLFSAQLSEAYDEKVNLYVGTYNIPRGNVIPFVVNTLGAIEKRSYEWLRLVVRSIAGDDDGLYSIILAKIKYRIASTVARGEAAVLERLRRLNSSPEGDRQQREPQGGQDVGETSQTPTSEGRGGSVEDDVEENVDSTNLPDDEVDAAVRVETRRQITNSARRSTGGEASTERPRNSRSFGAILRSRGKVLTPRQTLSRMLERKTTMGRGGDGFIPSFLRALGVNRSSSSPRSVSERERGSSGSRRERSRDSLPDD
jgi:hypothetical protein